MKKILIATFVLSSALVVLDAQDAPPVPFVASVKKAADGFGSFLRLTPGGISISGIPVRLLIRQAYGQLQDSQLVGGPDWINSERFDIEAKPEGGGPNNPTMVQSILKQLLEERFSLRVHKETRQLPVYALVLARSDGRLGPNLKQTSPDCAARRWPWARRSRRSRNRARRAAARRSRRSRSRSWRSAAVRFRCASDMRPAWRRLRTPSRRRHDDRAVCC